MSDEQIARRDAESTVTPGPWKVSHACPYHVHGKDGSLAAVAQGHESCLANARLIASAPDLLASVERLEREREEMRATLEKVADCTYGKIKFELWQEVNRLAGAEKLLAGG